MTKKRLKFALSTLLVPSVSVFGAAGRPSDGFLSFIVLLGFLGIILGILYLVDYIKILIRRFMESNGEDIIN